MLMVWQVETVAGWSRTFPFSQLSSAELSASIMFTKLLWNWFSDVRSSGVIKRNKSALSFYTLFFVNLLQKETESLNISVVLPKGHLLIFIVAVDMEWTRTVGITILIKHVKDKKTWRDEKGRMKQKGAGGWKDSMTVPVYAGNQSQGVNTVPCKSIHPLWTFLF